VDLLRCGGVTKIPLHPPFSKWETGKGREKPSFISPVSSTGQALEGWGKVYVSTIVLIYQGVLGKMEMLAAD